MLPAYKYFFKHTHYSLPLQLKKRTMERKSSRDGILAKVGNSLKNGLTNGLSAGGSIVGGGGGGGGRHESTGDAKGEFDDLISALRTGDVFGEDMAKFKRSRKSRIASNGNSPPRMNSWIGKTVERES